MALHPPDVGRELCLALQEDGLVAGLGGVLLELLGDVERHGEGALARRPRAWHHQARHRGRHVHSRLWNTNKR